MSVFFFTYFQEDYHRARSSSTGGDGSVNDRERGYNRGGGNSRKYSYDDEMSSRRGDWKCMEVNFYI